MSTEILSKLAKSSFRNKFKLSEKDLLYIDIKGMDIIRSHAVDFIKERIAPEVIKNDGKKTPMKNHPVFVAQHATATCCRSCIAKWHNISKGFQMTEVQQKQLLNIIMLWIQLQYNENKQMRLRFEP